MSEPVGRPSMDGAELEVARLALLGRLTRGVVHELNNPLFVVLALAELMQRSAEPGSNAAERLAQMVESGGEMRRLIGAIGELARTPVDGPLAPVHLAPVLLETVELIRRLTLRKDVDLVERYDDEGAAVLAGRGELRVALLGLLVDAQEGTPEEGRIEVVSLRRGDRAQVAVRFPGPCPEPGLLEPLERIVESVVAGRGGSIRRGTSAAGGCETVLSLPLHVAPADY